MSQPVFKKGDRVEKYTGDYSWPGVVRAVFTPTDDDPSPTRYVVAHKVGRGHVLHIYAGANLRRAAPWPDPETSLREQIGILMYGRPGATKLANRPLPLGPGPQQYEWEWAHGEQAARVAEFVLEREATFHRTTANLGATIDELRAQVAGLQELLSEARRTIDTGTPV